MKRNITYLIIGVIATASLWWLTEKLLDKHIGPRVGLGSADRN